MLILLRNLGLPARIVLFSRHGCRACFVLYTLINGVGGRGGWLLYLKFPRYCFGCSTITVSITETTPTVGRHSGCRAASPLWISRLLLPRCAIQAMCLHFTFLASLTHCNSIQRFTSAESLSPRNAKGLHADGVTEESCLKNVRMRRTSVWVTLHKSGHDDVCRAACFTITR